MYSLYITLEQAGKAYTSYETVFNNVVQYEIDLQIDQPLVRLVMTQNQPSG